MPPSPARPEPAPAADNRLSRALLLAVIVLCALPLILPGDAPWINDEPMLIQDALHANQQHSLAAHGLLGTHGVNYGPLPVWIYQGLLLISHNPIVLIVIRAALVTALTALALLWMARSLRLPAGFVIVLMLSPYLWLYSRQLWDNSFCIPLAALVFAGYAAFVADGSALGWGVCVICLVLLPLIHLMALALIVPCAICIIWFHPRSIAKYKWTLALAITGVAVLAAPYWHELFTSIRSNAKSSPTGLAGWWFPLHGARFFSGCYLSDFLGRDWFASTPKPLPWILTIAWGVALVAYPLVWGGMILAVRRAALIFQKSPVATAVDHLAVLALGVWVCQTFLDGLNHVYRYPHYFNATWIAYAFFAWLSVDALCKIRLGRWIIPLHGSALAALLLGAIILIHQSGGTRGHAYGPTIANQMEVAEKVRGYSWRATILTVDFDQWTEFPWARETLDNLLDWPQSDRMPQGKLVLRHRNPKGNDGWIELVELPSDR